MTNPNNAVGTPAALNGRTSVEAFNDLAQMLTAGILSGWTVSPSSGMTVSIGGVSGVRDVAIAENPSGLLTTVNNISKTPIPLTIATASTTSSRVDSIVAYVNSPASSSAAATDNPSVCGLLDVQGTTSAPTEEMIRSAITNDGGTGTTAYYVVLAAVSIPANTTTITGSNITAGNKSSLANLAIGSDNIADDAITSSKISNGAIGTTQIANGAITNAKMASNSINTTQIANGAVTNAKIEQGAVEADNINFATFGNQSSSLTNTSTISFGTDGYTTILSKTISVSGTYLLIGVVSCYLYAQGFTTSTMFLNNTQLSHSPAGATPNTSYGDTAGTTCVNIAQCNAGDVVYLKAGGGTAGGGSGTNRSSLAVVRIG